MLQLESVHEAISALLQSITSGKHLSQFEMAISSLLRFYSFISAPPDTWLRLRLRAMFVCIIRVVAFVFDKHFLGPFGGPSGAIGG